MLWYILTFCRLVGLSWVLSIIFTATSGKTTNHGLLNSEKCLNRNILHLCEQKHRCAYNTCIYVCFYVLHQAEFPHLSGPNSRSSELCHQVVPIRNQFYTSVSVWTEQHYPVHCKTRPSKHKIYLSVDFNINEIYLSNFSTVLEMLWDEQTLSQPQNPPWCTKKPFWSLHQEVTFLKKGWVVRERKLGAPQVTFPISWNSIFVSSFMMTKKCAFLFRRER